MKKLSNVNYQIEALHGLKRLLERQIALTIRKRELFNVEMVPSMINCSGAIFVCVDIDTSVILYDLLNFT